MYFCQSNSVREQTEPETQTIHGVAKGRTQQRLDNNAFLKALRAHASYLFLTRVFSCVKQGLFRLRYFPDWGQV